MDALDRLAKNMRKLPAVGAKTALRYAYSIVDMSKEDAMELVASIMDVKEKIHFCKECGAYAENDLCEICSSRDKTVICVVKSPKDIAPIEKAAGYKGVYHVLHNTLDFQKGIGVDDIRLKELMSRLVGVKEVILALNSDVSGEMTSTYIANSIKPLGITVSRLASGIPMGAELEYADEVTLNRAFTDRKTL